MRDFVPGSVVNSVPGSVPGSVPDFTPGSVPDFTPDFTPSRCGADEGNHLGTAVDALLTACRLLSVEHQRLLTRAAAAHRTSLAVGKAGAQLAAAVAELTAEARRPPGPERPGGPHSGEPGQPGGPGEQGGPGGLHAGAALLRAAVGQLATAYNRAAPRGGQPRAAESDLYVLGVASVLRTAARALAAELSLAGAVDGARELGGLDRPLDLLRDRFAPPVPGGPRR
ncbi:hypothetical protein [Streptomyces sp. NPDC050504]|uniref:hypothetical protein n=1 Tax=Streptomyces sp. NPDC050504 TaxID=3365618 RepID=UPI0037B0EBAE